MVTQHSRAERGALLRADLSGQIRREMDVDRPGFSVTT